MYIELAVLATFIFLYSLIAGRLERTAASGPIVFVTAGIIMGPVGLGWFDGESSSNSLRVLADITLALFLFIDAASADFDILKKQYRIPFRMLVFGLPGAILLGTIFASVLFDILTIFEAAILGTILAATDAALGKAVITNKKVPTKIREGLNVESGLNDGLCVPILLLFIALAKGDSAHGGNLTLAVTLVLEELGIGLMVGLIFSLLATWLLKRCYEKEWLSKVWLQMTVVALAISCFATAQSLHGSGYIAAFSGGLLFGYRAKELTHKLIFAAEGIGETVALMTWMLFGAAVVGKTLEYYSWTIFVYVLLSLTVVRILPIFLSLAGSGESVSSKLFLGWFGPRGLASIVFAIIVVNESLPGSNFIALVVIMTVFTSLIVHGVSANPLARWIGNKENKR